MTVGNSSTYTGSLNLIGDGIGFDPGTVNALGSECVEVQGPSTNKPLLWFRFGSMQQINTIYLMGSVMNNDDLVGARMFLYDDTNSVITSCGSSGAISIDGSGFYSCNTQAKTIAVDKPAYGGKFTICDLTIYEEENLIS